MRSIPSIALLAAVLSIASGCEVSRGREDATPPVAAAPAPLTPNSLSREARVARAKALELPTAYVPPPGDPLDHHAAGFAKVVCSAVFITGLDAEFAAANVGYLVPLEARARLGKPIIDRADRTVKVALPNGALRTAKYVGSQGCITLPAGETALHFTPVQVKSKLPPASTQKWPMGDAVENEPLPPAIDAVKLKQAVDAAFEPAAAMTAAYVVTWKGRIVAERYADGITAQTPLESWSMGKTVLATLMGILVKDGVYDLWQDAPIPEWRARGDDRAKIRIADLLRMSSGLRSTGIMDAEAAPDTYLDSLYLYTGGVDVSRYAATRPLQWPPGTVGRYRNVDVALVNYLVRLAVEKRGQDYLSFPQRALYDRIGMRSIVVETDPYGNYLFQGYDLAAARDWARLGNLYLQGGVWNGERILSREYVEFVRTAAPAWADDARPVYGGFIWLNRAHWWAGPEDSYAMVGAGGQSTVIIPTHDLVVVRMGHWRGEQEGEASSQRALKLLLEAVPQARQVWMPGPARR